MKKIRLIALMTILALALLSLSLPAVAHEGREVGDFLIELGWRVEPAYTTLFNGPEFTVLMRDDEKGVEGLEDTLSIEVGYGGRTKALRLRALSGAPGHYVADLIPTQPGDYSFRITGKIDEVEVEEVFDSANGEFSSVDPISDIQFP